MKSFLLLFGFFCNIVQGYNILYLTPAASRSHMNVFEPLIQELAKRNHQLTVIAPYPLTRHQQNIREILTDKKELDPSKLSKQFFESGGATSVFSVTYFKYIMAPSCESYLTHPEVKALIKKGKQFDVAIINSIFNECAMATAPLLAKTIVIHSPSSLVPWNHAIIPRPPSFVPLNIVGLGSKMNFFQRLENSISGIILRLIVDYDYIPYIQKTIANNLRQNPSITEAAKMVSFTLTNADPVITPLHPSMPMVVNVGGLHCRKAESLPKEFEDFIQSSGENGFILFSLGSNAQSKDMPKDMVTGLLRAFSRLKQHVIWKFEEELENLPKNVKISKWLPQKDILGHPKIRLFITHGGMLSLQESVYNAVPLIAIPLFAEQPGNVARVVEIEIGVKLSLLNLTDVSMFEAISTILGDKKYANNMKRYSNIFRNFVENQVEKAAFWIEYVIRHQGAPHFGSPGEELNFVKYFLLDVICFMLVLISILIWGIVKYAKILIQIGRSKKNKVV